MKRLIIKKLIVISQNEAKSLEVPFSTGLNIILGGNKTGKSSIIKSIFTSFGCACPKIESDWKTLISTYILYFFADSELYCIKRMGDRFSIYSVDQSNTHTCVIDTAHFHEYSNALMNILQVSMPCIDLHGNEINITPPLLFRFQYIDQDEGWGDIGTAFTNMGYIKKWRENTNKYVCGYLTEDYYSLVRDSVKKQSEIEGARTEHAHNEAFVNRISSIISSQQSRSPMDTQQALEEILLATEQMRNELFDIESEIARVENELFIIRQQLKVAKQNQIDVKKDASYAMMQADVIVCPVCGAHYDNGIEQQLHIASEHATAENLVNFLEEEKAQVKKQLALLKSKQRHILSSIAVNEAQIQAYKQQLSYKTYFLDEGKRDVYLSCQQELQALQTEIEKKIGQKSIIDARIQELKSRKRANEIRQSIISYCGQVADQINLSRTFIKLKDFVQVIDKSGSDTPRLVYMYHVAMYLFNLDRIKSPFNFLVIDTPNQQGQDEANLNRIFKSLELLTSTNGQVIIGTERDTGLENRAANVIRFTESRRCLTGEHYAEHLELSQHLHTLGLAWVHDKHLAEKVTV